MSHQCKITGKKHNEISGEREYLSVFASLIIHQRQRKKKKGNYSTKNTALFLFSMFSLDFENIKHTN